MNWYEASGFLEYRISRQWRLLVVIGIRWVES